MRNLLGQLPRRRDIDAGDDYIVVGKTLIDAALRFGLDKRDGLEDGTGEKMDIESYGRLPPTTADR